MLSREEIKGIWCDSYNFYLKYTGKPSEPGMWDRAVNDFSKIMQKYNGCPACCHLMIAALGQLEEETGALQAWKRE